MSSFSTTDLFDNQWVIAKIRVLPLALIGLFTLIFIVDHIWLHAFKEHYWRIFIFLCFNLGVNHQLNKYTQRISDWMYGIYHFQPKAWLLWIFITFCAVNTLASPLLRRFIFFFYLLPVLYLITSCLLKHYKSNQYYKKISIALMFMLILCWSIPSLYLPPFFSGIAGWTNKIDVNAPIRVPGLELVRDDGKTVWFTNSIIDPMNFLLRELQAEGHKGKEQLTEYLDFCLAVYNKQYYLLKKGKYVTERFSPLGFPEDNPSNMQDYKNFPPERIRKIIFSNKYYDAHTLKFIKNTITYEYDIKTKKLEYK